MEFPRLSKDTRNNIFIFLTCFSLYCTYRIIYYLKISLIIDDCIENKSTGNKLLLEFDENCYWMTCLGVSVCIISLVIYFTIIFNFIYIETLIPI